MSAWHIGCFALGSMNPPNTSLSSPDAPDAPHWGGLSGCTFRESESWGKYNRDAVTATVYADATIALPLLVTALSQKPDART